LKEKKILGIIPARGGSKGIHKKNIAHLSGKPLISYTIDAACNSKLLTKVIVSTDDLHIADIAKNLGCEVPFIRPDDLSGDSVLTFPVLTHAIKYLQKNNNETYDAILLLQPTSPFRASQDIDNSINLLDETVDCVISVSNVGGNHPLRMKKIVNGRLVNYNDSSFEDMRPRQLLPEVFIRNGSIYLAKIDSFEKNKGFYSSKTVPYIMPYERSVNIDSHLDLLVAQEIQKIQESS
jgi:CMP-N,N'-diacetyllegionaminic acid synthase